MSVTLPSLFDEVLYYSTRIKCRFKFEDHFGDPAFSEIFASGIWMASRKSILSGGKHFFYVTNRHVVDFDYTTIYKNQGFESLEDVDVELRQFNRNTPLGTTKFFDLVSVQNKIYFPKDGSDLAVIAVSMQLTKMKEAQKLGFRPHALSLDDYLATGNYFESELRAIDPITFIGFPTGVYDQISMLPIARNANVASSPRDKFKNDAINGDLILASGLSFGGSSGSPVYSLPIGNKAIGVGRVLEPKFIGTISGHLFDMAGHKGLSYFVKSTKILETLQEHNLI